MATEALPSMLLKQWPRDVGGTSESTSSCYNLPQPKLRISWKRRRQTARAYTFPAMIIPTW